jgi:hypothetical protein
VPQSDIVCGGRLASFSHLNFSSHTTSESWRSFTTADLQVSTRFLPVYCSNLTLLGASGRFWSRTNTCRATSSGRDGLAPLMRVCSADHLDFFRTAPPTYFHQPYSYQPLNEQRTRFTLQKSAIAPACWIPSKTLLASLAVGPHLGPGPESHWSFFPPAWLSIVVKYGAYCDILDTFDDFAHPNSIEARLVFRLNSQ